MGTTWYDHSPKQQKRKLRVKVRCAAKEPVALKHDQGESKREIEKSKASQSNSRESGRPNWSPVWRSAQGFAEPAINLYLHKDESCATKDLFTPNRLSRDGMSIKDRSITFNWLQ
jgi:phosphatidate phosphatase APP1